MAPDYISGNIVKFFPNDCVKGIRDGKDFTIPNDEFLGFYYARVDCVEGDDGLLWSMQISHPSGPAGDFYLEELDEETVRILPKKITQGY